MEFPSDMHVNGFCVGDWNGDRWPDLIVTRDVYSPPTPDGKQNCRGTVWSFLRFQCAKAAHDVVQVSREHVELVLLDLVHHRLRPQFIFER